MSETSNSNLDALAATRLPELKKIASSLGIKGVATMRKAEIIGAILSNQTPGGRPVEDDDMFAEERNVQRSRQHPEKKRRPYVQSEEKNDDVDPVAQRLEQAYQSSGRVDQQTQSVESALKKEEASDEVGARLEALSHDPKVRERLRERDNHTRADHGDSEQTEGGSTDRPIRSRSRSRDEENNSRSRRQRRQRDRSNRRSRSDAMDDTIREDDVLVEVHGILDVLENYAFVRTNGYLPSPDDAYVSLSMVRKNGLRKGDIVAGAIRQPREGERREKYNPLVRIDSVNGMDLSLAKDRPEFAKLTPLYPEKRLRMEDSAKNMTGRIIDLVAPIGKGQRGLIVSPPKAGKTMVMQSIANAITTNNPEVHLMVVLVDERPEEVTDFQRTTTGEVIASTFDRPAEDHTTIAELAIERAKRLVEMGRDVVVLLDGITRLGRAYNLAAPASGRILSGGVDSAALYPPKKFFGAARNIENGGSLTILATALVETGSKMDEVIFEEFKGTGNMELRLSRQLADKRIFPAINVEASGTRREDLLMGRTELDVIWKLRRYLSGLEDQQALEMLLTRMRKTENNAAFLSLILKTNPAD